MADIRVTCTKCAHETVVSEFAEPDSLPCGHCGAPLPTPRANTPAASAAAAGPRLTVRPQPPPLPGSAAPEPPLFDEKRDLERMRRKRRQAKASLRQNQTLAWILFALFGAGTGVLRYGGVLPHAQLKLLQEYAVIILLAFHVLIVIKAFTDNAMHGILCFFVPFYSLYYVFMICDDFILRGVFAGILVGIGEDSAVVLQDKLSGVMQGVSAWIRSGG